MISCSARTGPRTARAVALAGSAQVWFDTCRRHGDAAGGTFPATSLSAPDLERLSGLRPAICGLTLDRPRIMGILNVTPDSFSDGGDLSTVDAALKRARAMAGDADILDIGGESTRPGAEEVPVAEEIARTAPVIAAIRDAGIDTPISIDTRKAAVAAAALDAGASMVNDVSAMSYDPDMAALVAERDVPICLMHAQGDPKTMQKNPSYGDVVKEVFAYLGARAQAAIDAGIAPANVIADPGIGFGKTLEHNLAILRDLAAFHDLGCPLLLGASRKRFIGTLGQAPEPRDRMAGSIAVALHAATQGVHILRVHDVKETRQALRLFVSINEEFSNA